MLNIFAHHLSYRTKLIIWVVIIKILVKIKLIISAFLFSSKVGLFPDEAYYWTWSQTLSNGYYSKPLAIAYQIAFGCSIFGNSEIGARVGSFLLSCFLSMAVFYLAKKAALPEKMAFIAALAFTLTPLGLSSTFLATPDCGALLFWTLSCAIFVDDLMQKRKNRYLLLGLLIGIGALFSWSSFLLWIPILGFSLWYKKTSPVHFLTGFGFSLLALIPSLMWNCTHNFATLYYFEDMFTSHTEPHPLYFIGMQFFLLSPLLMILFTIAFCKMGVLIKKIPPSLLFCFTVSAFTLATAFGISCLRNVQNNWAIFTYPTGFIILLSYANMQCGRFLRWIYGGVVFSCVLFLSLLSILILEKHHHDGLALPYRLNPFNEALGWDNLTASLQQIGFNPKEQFLFSDRYQTASILSFYSPAKTRAYFFDMHHAGKNQFSFWPQMHDNEKDRNGYYVGIVEGPGCLDRVLAIQQEVQNDLQKYFTTITPPPLFVPLLVIKGQVLKVAFFIYCKEYNGEIPS